MKVKVALRAAGAVMALAVFAMVGGCKDSLSAKTEIKPAEVYAEQQSASSVYIYWTPIANPEGYTIYREGSDGTATSFSVSAQTNTYLDSGVELGVVYRYSVSATKYGGAEGHRQAAAPLTIAEMPDAPGTVNDVSITETIPDPDANKDNVTLSWQEVSDADFYKVQRTVDRQTWVDVYQGSTAGCFDTGLSLGTYYYRVRAMKNANPTPVGGPWSIEVEACLQKGIAGKPNAPTGLSFTINNNKVNLM